MSDQLKPKQTQSQIDRELMVQLSTLAPDERAHLLNLINEGTILDCIRKEAK